MTAEFVAAEFVVARDNEFNTIQISRSRRVHNNLMHKRNQRIYCRWRLRLRNHHGILHDCLVVFLYYPVVWKILMLALSFYYGLASVLLCFREAIMIVVALGLLTSHLTYSSLVYTQMQEMFLLLKLTRNPYVKINFPLSSCASFLSSLQISMSKINDKDSLLSSRKHHQDAWPMREKDCYIALECSNHR